MRQQPKIKWRDKDIEKLRKEVRRFNAKRAREIKKNPEIKKLLPDKLSVRTLRKEIETRAEFNKQIRSIDRFMRPKSTQIVTTSAGVQTTQYQIGELRAQVASINARRRAELRGREPSPKTGTMRTIQEENLQPKKFDLKRIQSQKEFEKFVESVEKQAAPKYWRGRYDLYKENYLKAFREQLLFGENGAELYSRLKDISSEHLVDLLYRDPTLGIDFVYAPEDINARITSINYALDKYGL